MKVMLISVRAETIAGPVFPMGLACIAAAARRAGHDVIVKDMRPVEKTSVLSETIKEFYPDVIGISVRNIDDQNMEEPSFLLDEAASALAECRKLSKAPIVLGGAGFSIFPEAALSYVGADMGIEGEGEIAFPALLDRLERGEDLAGLPGLHVAGQGLQGKRSFVRTLDGLPFPDYGDFPLSAAQRDLWVQVQGGRGCPLGCSYCSTAAVEGRTKRKRSADVLVRELGRLAAGGFRRFYFVDNTFNLPLTYAKEICRRIIEAGLDIRWMCIIYPAYVDEEFVRLMAEAGCRHASLGLESGSEKILRSMNKRFTPDDVRRASHLLAECGINQMGFLLLGGPGETRETVEESIAFAESLKIDMVKATIGIRIYPGTELARTAAAEGVIAPDDNLLHPRFYLAKGLEEWLRERIRRWATERPKWVS